MACLYELPIIVYENFLFSNFKELLAIFEP